MSSTRTSRVPCLGSSGFVPKPAFHVIALANGGQLSYDGLIIASGSLGAAGGVNPGDGGEHVVRALADAAAIADRIPSTRTAVVIGGGFLGTEVASTLRSHGIDVAVIDRSPPLQCLLGKWLAGIVVEAAIDAGEGFVIAQGNVSLTGKPLNGVHYGDAGFLEADLIIFAVGDTPNVEWLAGSGLQMEGGLVVENSVSLPPASLLLGASLVVRPLRVSAVVLRIGAVLLPRAVLQLAAYLTRSPLILSPTITSGQNNSGLTSRSQGAPLQWATQNPRRYTGNAFVPGPVASKRAAGAAATVNYRMPVARLKDAVRAG